MLSGEIPEAPGENWRAVNFSLYQGLRGLPGGDSLAKLLARERGESRASGGGRKRQFLERDRRGG